MKASVVTDLLILSAFLSAVSARIQYFRGYGHGVHIDRQSDHVTSNGERKMKGTKKSKKESKSLKKGTKASKKGAYASIESGVSKEVGYHTNESAGSMRKSESKGSDITKASKTFKGSIHSEKGASYYSKASKGTRDTKILKGSTHSVERLSHSSKASKTKSSKGEAKHQKSKSNVKSVSKGGKTMKSYKTVHTKVSKSDNQSEGMTSCELEVSDHSLSNQLK